MRDEHISLAGGILLLVHDRGERSGVSGGPTQQDVARLAGVSRGLVSLALSDSKGVSAETRQRILRAAEELGYVRNLSAAALAGALPTALGVVLPDLRNPFFEEVVAEINAQSSAMGLLPIIVTSQDAAAQERLLLTKLHELRVAGCILVSPASSPKDLSSMDASLPLAVIGDESYSGGVDAVRMDEVAAAHLVVARVQTRGAEAVLYLSSQDGSTERGVKARADALSRALGDLSFEHIHLEDSSSPGDLLAQRVSELRLAVIAHNDLLGADTVTAARALGLVPGTDFQLISYDDTHLAARPEFSLTSIQQNSRQLVGEALLMLEERRHRPAEPGRSALSSPELTVRTSG